MSFRTYHFLMNQIVCQSNVYVTCRSQSSMKSSCAPCHCCGSFLSSLILERRHGAIVIDKGIFITLLTFFCIEELQLLLAEVLRRCCPVSYFLKSVKKPQIMLLHASLGSESHKKITTQWIVFCDWPAWRFLKLFYYYYFFMRRVKPLKSRKGSSCA